MKTDFVIDAARPPLTNLKRDRVDRGTSFYIAEWGRWQDVQRIFGIKRGKLYLLIKQRRVRSITLCEQGNKHGCRLIHLGSVREYLNGLLAVQEAEQ